MRKSWARGAPRRSAWSRNWSRSWRRAAATALKATRRPRRARSWERRRRWRRPGSLVYDRSRRLKSMPPAVARTRCAAMTRSICGPTTSSRRRWTPRCPGTRVKRAARINSKKSARPISRPRRPRACAGSARSGLTAATRRRCGCGRIRRSRCSRSTSGSMRERNWRRNGSGRPPRPYT